MSGNRGIYRLEHSVILTVIGIIFLFMGAISVTLIAPRYVDPSWTQPSSEYQKQMYEIIDPHVYVSRSFSGGDNIQYVYHLIANQSVLKFSNSATVKIIAPKSLQKYVNKEDAKETILTSRLLLLREPTNTPEFPAKDLSEKLQEKLKDQWLRDHPDERNQALNLPKYEIFELYNPGTQEVFSVASANGILENWVDENFTLYDKNSAYSTHEANGLVYIQNPKEFLISKYMLGKKKGWKLDSHGSPVKNIKQLKEDYGFLSRKELIEMGEAIYAEEGCWYCHTMQTRTLVQDTVLNGSDNFPAPPSSASEYIYENITFPGTQRNGPDLSRVAIKRPGRDWHKAHFWSPKTESPGSIMPSYRHFFDFDPRGTSKNPYGVPNYKFEAIYQYLMTKGSRITSPNQAWWQGRDPVQTKEIIEGRKSG